MALALLASGLVAVAGPLPQASATDPVIGWVWAQQFAENTTESGGANVVDAAGNIYVVGSTDGTLPGSPEANAGDVDAFVAKFDPSGTQLWVHQLGSADADAAHGVALDASGNVYVTGSTYGTLPGASETNPGSPFSNDMFLAKFDASGTALWVHQSGTTAPEFGQSVAVDSSGNAVVAGTDTFVVRFPTITCCDNVLVVKFDPSGNQLWSHEIGGSDPQGDDSAGGVAVDSAGDVYVSGTTTGGLFGSPETDAGAFLQKFDPTGTIAWVHALPGTTTGGPVTVDAAGNADLTGSTTADDVVPSLDPPAGGNDGFVAAYDASGVRQWVHRFGSSADDAGTSIARNGSGEVYATGYVAGQAVGAPEGFGGQHDVVLLKYDAAGDPLFIHQYGGPGNEDPSGLFADAFGNVYVSGTADGHVPRAHPPSFGTSDAFLSKYGELVPTEPGAPENAAAQPATGSLIVSFQAPSDDGGVLPSYTASCASPTGGVPGSVSGPSSPITVAPLTNGKTYQCSVTATNTVGTGPASALTLNAKPATTKSIIAGGPHACAQKHEGTVLCWGSNSSGELGDGTTTNRLAPVPVSGLTNPAALAAGAKHTCSLLAGSVQCWGDNSFGQIGDGTTTNQLAPTLVFGLFDATAISSLKNHTCVVRSNRTVRCWGANAHGQLGDNSTITRTKPVVVSGIGTATAVSAGTDHSCALLSDTTVKCWGSNAYGQLGDGTLVEHHTPVTVVGLSSVTAIKVLGQSTCAIVTGGGVRCWGLNDSGQVGDGTTINRKSPVVVVGLSNTSSLAGGLYHSCAVRPNGTMKCWGDNSFGQIGDGTFTDRTTPVAVPVANVATITAGANDSFARLQSGAVFAWGANAAGQLGDGTTATATPTPQSIPAFG
jgi:alpha-tubulin suppressor-like RCC1 family protein